MFAQQFLLISTPSSLIRSLTIHALVLPHVGAPYVIMALFYSPDIYWYTRQASVQSIEDWSRVGASVLLSFPLVRIRGYSELGLFTNICEGVIWLHVGYMLVIPFIKLCPTAASCHRIIMLSTIHLLLHPFPSQFSVGVSNSWRLSNTTNSSPLLSR